MTETIEMTETIDITRVYDAPRERVFAAWTQPELMKPWYGPRGFSLPHCTVDLRPGGLVHLAMRTPEGQDVWCRGIYREVVVPERLVCTDSFSDAQGNIVPAAQAGMSAEWPDEALLTLTFTEREGKTTVTLRHDVGHAPATERDQCKAGWTEMLDRLGEFLAGESPR
ncbi:MAG TPA: SRPBCC domain-containing protein [Terriglobales bacterium]|nr:SRPBCC domain-containing protein [Terriglobales bacterium]